MDKSTEQAEVTVLLTRTQAARRMGVSVSTLRRMEGVAVDPILIDGKHLFRAAEIDGMRPQSDGEVAARAFRAFQEGSSVIDVVIELQQTPEVIEALHAKWVKLTHSLVILSASILPFQRLFLPTVNSTLTPYLVQQCLLIVANQPDNLERLRTSLYVDLGAGLPLPR